MNTLPSAPTGLKAQVISSAVTLSWGTSHDRETPDVGLTYNLRIGTTPGGAEVLSALARSDGTRLVVQGGNEGHRRTATIQGIQPDTQYYWSVQAIDTTLAGSPFAAEGRFDTFGDHRVFMPQVLAGGR